MDNMDTSLLQQELDYRQQATMQWALGDAVVFPPVPIDELEFDPPKTRPRYHLFNCTLCGEETRKYTLCYLCRLKQKSPSMGD